MIKKGQLRTDQVIFVYSQPPEEAFIGVVYEVQYPLVYAKTILREAKHKFKNKEVIDLSYNPSITILSEDQIKNFLTQIEKKRLKEIREDEVIDIFGIHN